MRSRPSIRPRCSPTWRACRRDRPARGRRRHRIAAIRRAVARRFRASGMDSPDLDARLIVGHALGLDHAGLMRESERALGPRALAAIDALAARRLAGEPVARILGVKEFWGLPFAVTPAVLVPRPETETVVETALARLDAAGVRERPLRIADLGTGSGAILLALLHELPQACGIGTDCSARGHRDRAGECAAARLRGTRGLRRLRFRRRARRRPRSRRRQPALCRERRDRDAAPRGPRLRPASPRSTAGRTALPPIAPSSPMPDGCWRRARFWSWRSGPASRTPCRLSPTRQGLPPSQPPPISPAFRRVVSRAVIP